MPAAAEIAKLICLVATCASWSVTLNVTVNGPDCVVAPEMTPVAESIEYPEGSPVALKIYVPLPVPPVTASVTPLG